MTGQFGGRKRSRLHPWQCPLCERRVTAVSMWLDHRGAGGDSAVYFHADNERCFVANHRVAEVVSHISEIDKPRAETDGTLE